MRFGRQLIIGHTALLFVTILTGITAAIALRVTSSETRRCDARDRERGDRRPETALSSGAGCRDQPWLSPGWG